MINLMKKNLRENKENNDELKDQENINNKNPKDNNKKIYISYKAFIILFYLIFITSSILTKILLDKIFISEYNYSS